MLLKNILYSTRMCPAILLVLASSGSYGTEYWVSKSGDDQNNCLNSTTDACLTIQKGVSRLAPGDTLNVKVGTYSDDGGAGPYSPPGTFCGWLDSEPASSNVCVNNNGTAESPITLQAAPGDEGRVVIDAQGNKVGIHLQNSDYIRIRGFKIINARTAGIASWGQPENNVADESRLSIGVVVENNSILNTTGQWGKNTSAVALWGTKDWIVRNNFIDGVSAEGGSLASGMQSYGVINALIENNHIINADFGIYWKDHFIADLTARTSIFESEIRYNLIQSRDRGITLGIKGSNTVEVGDNHIHHNIIYGFGNWAAGIQVATAGAFAKGGQIVIEHNILDGANNSSFGISADSTDDLRITGNIILRTSLVLELVNYSGSATKRVALSESNYNVYDASGFQIYADRYSSSGGSLIYDLADWQKLVESDLMSLDVSNPDRDSITVNATSLFLSDVDDGYRLAEGSSATGLMPDGSSAGPYQYGNEIVGLLPAWPAYDSSILPSKPAAAAAPSGFTVRVIR
ncbi:right-handed parallel beta-helix repeat-containing protein [Pseudomonadales bacterium]|nr:right-handed parallel beta-helix repeat-containing protein [Pseudomonadales bacterium]MDB4450892.1 right-handed parallel beta-helix repeat-containing protein [Pseudomonadales bacterium]MDB4806521.1 right-handed parallel beta-helix repeat-containing protein [Pseudomonadales bacterium]